MGKGINLGSACKEMGFPITHKHKLATLRQELIDAFVDNRYMMFLKFAALHLQQLGAKKQEVSKVPVVKEKEESEKDEKEKKDNKEIEAEEAKKIVENVTESIAAEKQVE